MFTKYEVNNWEVKRAKSPFFGLHETGIVNIEDGEFTEEEMAVWIESGALKPVN